MLSSLYMFSGLIVIAALAHLIGLRAERHGRRYWVWFLLALPFGPIGTLLTLVLLEASIRRQAEDHSSPTIEDARDLREGKKERSSRRPN